MSNDSRTLDVAHGRMTEHEREGMELLNKRRAFYAKIANEPATRSADVMAAECKIPNLFALCCRANEIIRQIHNSSVDRFGQSVKTALRLIAEGEITK